MLSEDKFAEWVGSVNAFCQENSVAIVGIETFSGKHGQEVYFQTAPTDAKMWDGQTKTMAAGIPREVDGTA